MRASRILLLLAVVTGTLIVPRALVLGAGAIAGPSLTVAPSAGDLGALVMVTLERWPKGLATVSVCGNNALRGSQDCDLRGALVVTVPPGGTLQLTVALVAPPVPCPCVVRVATTTSEVVQTTPIEVRGAPMSETPMAPTQSVGVETVTVTARLENVRESWPESWAPAFSGPVHRKLIVTLRNNGSAPTPPLKVVAGVGRETGSGEALPVRELAALAPGEPRTLSIPVEISGPTWGDYVVFGRVYGLDAPLEFRRATSNAPWALELVVPLGLLIAAQLVRRHERARRRREEALAQARAAATAAPLAECSPDVGVRAGERCTTRPYDPNEHKVAREVDAMVPTSGANESESMSMTRAAQR